MAAVVVDDSNMILATVLDAVQAKIAFDTAGAITTDLNQPILSKDDPNTTYGLTAEASATVNKSWGDQAAAFAEWTVGKDVAAVDGLALTDGDDAGVPTDPALTSSVSITVPGFQTAIDNAVANAK